MSELRASLAPRKKINRSFLPLRPMLPSASAEHGEEVGGVGGAVGAGGGRGLGAKHDGIVAAVVAPLVFGGCGGRALAERKKKNVPPTNSGALAPASIHRNLPLSHAGPLP